MTLWTYEDLAEYLNVSVRTAKRWTRERGIPHLRSGSIVRFDPDEVRAWVHEASVTTST